MMDSMSMAMATVVTIGPTWVILRHLLLQLVLMGTCVATPASSFHFLIPASGLGNVGRNTFISPGFQTYNLTVQRSFKIPVHDVQRQQILVRGEFLNAFNHPNLGIPSLNLTGGNFLNEAGTINGGREIRVLLRYSF